MKRLFYTLVCFVGFTLPVKADPVAIMNGQGRDLTVEISWNMPVDLDLFLTDLDGETVYFANRKARSGVSMGAMAGCQNIEASSPPYKETVHIPASKKGVYRISVDYIKTCESNALQVDFNVILIDRKTGMQLERGQSTVKYRLLDTVSWEFEIK